MMTVAEKLTALNRTLQQCRKSRFYRDRLPARPLPSLEALQDLPLTTKADLRAASPFGLLCVPKTELCQYHESFGTTGTPVSSWFTRQDLEDNAWEVAVNGVGFAPGDIVLIRFPYAISAAAHVFHEAAKLKGACVIPASSRSTVSPFPRVITMMRRLEVTVLAGLPLQALLLAETAELGGRDPRADFPSLRAICTAGESLSPSRRNLLEELWGVPIFNYYGLTELGNVAADCRFGRLHPAEDFFLIELLRADFRTPAKPGEFGYLVITTLRRAASPVVRYLTGDRARWVPEACTCGKQGYLEVRGRDEDLLRVGDRVLDLWDLEQILSHLPCRRFWVAAPLPGGVQFVVEQEKPLDWIAPDLKKSLERKYRLSLSFQVVPKGTLYDRRELLSVGRVGKPKYVYTEEELRQGAHLKSAKT